MGAREAEDVAIAVRFVAERWPGRQIILFARSMGAAAVLTPAAATPSVSTESTAAHESPFAYFPEQYVNQATEIEPVPSTF